MRNHPELKDAQIIRLVGTTKTTIAAVREGTHWNNANLTMMDPVTLGLCTQINLDAEVKKANKGQTVPDENEQGVRLLSAQEALSTAADAAREPASQHFASMDGTNADGTIPAPDVEIDVDAVFAKLTSLKSGDKDQ